MSSFQYSFLPADASQPAEARTASTAGGLTNDELLKEAKAYFFKQSGGDRKADALANASDDDKQVLVGEFRKSQPQFAHFSDDQILAFLQTFQTSPTCEIMALTVPTASNQYQAVSMYVSENSGDEPLPINARASALLQNCGHALPENQRTGTAGIYGDIFVGRAYDHEGQDEWTRVDLVPEDLEEGANWIKVARADGGGGGTGTSNVASLSNSFKSTVQQKQEQTDLGYTWEQTEDEVELKFPIEAAVKGKDVKIKFAKRLLMVTVSDKVLVDGEVGGNVRVDECTYTLQDGDNGGRELYVVLGKVEEGRTWTSAIAKK